MLAAMLTDIKAEKMAASSSRPGDRQAGGSNRNEAREAAADPSGRGAQ
jgi:hypothetical protein